MAKIKRLDMQTANGIAAGEVVERPASVIKEMLENSLDAGSDIITIHCRNGGISYMSIRDNGTGMDADDALEAFERHATSKLSVLEDLESLVSMGFRGEALAAISSVSKIEMQTKQEGDDYGTKVVIEAGELLEHVPTSCQTGTFFEIKELFYNTPARYKFLKKDATEAAKITEVVQLLALARPDVSFRLFHGGQSVVHTPGNNELLSAIYAIYGKTIAENVMPLRCSGTERCPSLRIEGYIGTPLSARKKRTHQLFYVNDRPVRSALLSKALEEGFRQYLMQGLHPFALLKITLPPNLIDVNVHPQKAELRFWDESEMYTALYHSVCDALAVWSKAPATEPEEPSPAQDASLQEKAAAAHEHNLADPSLQLKAEYAKRPGGSAFADDKLPAYQYADYAAFEPKPATYNTVAPLAENTNAYAENSHTTQADSDSNLPQKLLAGRLIGVAFATFILIELEEKLYLIDQHAAHERILYEEILEDFAKGKSCSQTLLDAPIISLNPSEQVLLNDNADYLHSLGFDFSDFSETEIVLRAVPASLSYGQVERAFLDCLDALAPTEAEGSLQPLQELNLARMATKACKSAVKANDKLSDMEIKALLEQLVNLANPLQCPHGRPTIIKLSKYDLEKMFKRVV